MCLNFLVNRVCSPGNFVWRLQLCSLRLPSCLLPLSCSIFFFFLGVFSPFVRTKLSSSSDISASPITSTVAGCAQHVDGLASVREALNFDTKSFAVATPANLLQNSFLSATNVLMGNFMLYFPLTQIVSLNVICPMNKKLLLLGPKCQ